MIIDCHTHIFPNKIKLNREDFFHGEKEFSLLYENPDSKISNAEELIASMDKNHIEKAVVFGFPWNNKEKAVFNNDYIMEKALEYKDRLIPFACFSPVADYAPEEAKRCLKNNFRGFGELGVYTSDFTDEIIAKFKPVMDLARKNNLPVMVHVNEPIGHDYPGKAPVSLKGILNFISKFSENKIILAHLGGGLPFYSMLKKPPELKNVLFDIAAIPYIYKKNIYEIIEKTDMDSKIAFGSDWPLIPPSRYIKEIQENKISNEFKSKIFSENIKNFLGI